MHCLYLHDKVCMYTCIHVYIYKYVYMSIFVYLCIYRYLDTVEGGHMRTGT